MEAASAESIAADEALLQLLAIAITDVQGVQTQMQKFWQERISALLPDTSDVLDENNPSPEGVFNFQWSIVPRLCSLAYVIVDALQRSLSSISSLFPPLSSQIINILSRRACEALLPMRSIPSQFRAMSSGKRSPSEPSYFISLVFRPFRSFFANDGPGAMLKETYAQAFAEEVVEIVAQRYVYRDNSCCANTHSESN